MGCENINFIRSSSNSTIYIHFNTNFNYILSFRFRKYKNVIVKKAFIKLKLLTEVDARVLENVLLVDWISQRLLKLS